ncbi:phosphoribosylglycinamide formyltransferase [Christensenellaceae bacterium NSJ-63]|uniref:Phosphoribosylglycinamide formyltransferase n=1 Tax=Guopingia tenuis TaxID=2763656 RepID=A0A926HUY6_9FIRM|nr:phosphoribosylglycinamide formyltransferase [Guopingia tenuis]MBC8537409.1 phosphoribosylglycinamide formyltransferase [Guopingia tenuis]
MKKLAVMVSGGGTDLQSIIDGIANGKIAGEIVLVISSKPGVYALTRAEKAGIPAKVISPRDFARQEDFFAANLAALQESGAEGIILAGYLSILSKEVVEAYAGRIINTHPALIPSFCGKGFYGNRVHQAVLDYGAKLSGATIHFVDEGADTGPIIMQEAVPVLPDDTVETLSARVLEVEHRILPESVALFCEDRLVLHGRTVHIL